MANGYISLPMFSGDRSAPLAERIREWCTRLVEVHASNYDAIELCALVLNLLALDDAIRNIESQLSPGHRLELGPIVGGSSYFAGFEYQGGSIGVHAQSFNQALLRLSRLVDAVPRARGSNPPLDYPTTPRQAPNEPST